MLSFISHRVAGLITAGILAVAVWTMQTPLAVADDQHEAELRTFYRELALKIRNDSTFSIPMPDADREVHISFNWGEPKNTEPQVFPSVQSDGTTERYFFDPIFTKDGSYMMIGERKVPITCLHIFGRDSRELVNPNPTFPKLLLFVRIVANDFSCVGPKKPGWPETGGREETWDTFIYYKIPDPTIMLPVDAVLRWRWNEYNAILMK